VLCYAALMTRRCMPPNDELADIQHSKAQKAISRADFAQAAWHETASAHLTTSRRPAVRGLRALQACLWWEGAGHYSWARDMAQAFLSDLCLPRPTRVLLRQIAQGYDVSDEDLGISLVGPGSGILTVLYWGMLAGVAWGAWKLGRYVVTGSFGPRYSTRVPAAWEVHG